MDINALLAKAKDRKRRAKEPDNIDKQSTVQGAYWCNPSCSSGVLGACVFVIALLEVPESKVSWRSKADVEHLTPLCKPGHN